MANCRDCPSAIRHKVCAPLVLILPVDLRTGANLDEHLQVNFKLKKDVPVLVILRFDNREIVLWLFN